MTSSADLYAAAMVCPWCDFHFALEAGLRLDLLMDEGSFRHLDSSPGGPSLFGRATLFGRPLALALGDPTACWTAAELRALIALVEEARQEHWPLLWTVAATQGVEAADLWPGLQMALGHLSEAALPWIALLTGPCYGPAAALALQADIVLAEPGTAVALVAPEALRQASRLPVESKRPPRDLLRAGWPDAVLSRQEQRAALSVLLDLLGGVGKSRARPPAHPAKEPRSDFRHPLPALESLLEPFFELHGDRGTSDDLALVGGLARLRHDGTRLLVLATARGQGWPEARRRHEGAIAASGWRKATRLLRLAGRFDLPVVALVDRPGLRLARSDRAEGLAAALGETLAVLLSLPVPSVAVHLDSGGGLASQVLSSTDCILTTAESAANLRGEGISPDGIIATPDDLEAGLAQQLRELTQTYSLHGAIGRRKLLQRRYTRWGRLFRGREPLSFQEYDLGEKP